MRFVVCLLVVLVTGCQYREPAPQTAPSAKPLPRYAPIVEEPMVADPDPPLAPFRGKPTPSITWDLWGDWEIMRTEREDGKAGAPGRWEESWHPRKRENKSKLVWVDPDRAETFTLVPGDGKGDRIRWRRYRGRIFDFSVSHQSYGLLQLTDQDGENYMAVRKEGGD